MSASPISIRDVMTDNHLFGDMFNNVSFAAWRSLLCGFYGLELTNDEAATFKKLTNRETLPADPHDELWLVIGRRGGKSQNAALLALYLAALHDYSDKLSPGEIATVMVLCTDRKAARSVFRYVSGLIQSNPMLSSMVVREDKETIELNNRTAIEISTASFRSVRGYTLAAVIADEIAFWRSDDSANPDYEIINALRPALATLNGKLIALSSPYAKRGELYNHYRNYYGKDDPSILVAQAGSMIMNPTLPPRVVAQAMERDIANTQAEYFAHFRSDLEAFVSREAVEACVEPGRYELGYISTNNYRGFVDPSGGSADSMTLAIGHDERRDGQTITIIDAVREVKPPFSPEAAVEDFCDLLKSYRINRVTGDRYAGEWPREQFRKRSIKYDLADRPRSDLYRDTLPLINSRQIELLDHQKLITQICGLERRTARSGKDSIDHAPGSHDDVANAVAGVAVSGRRGNYIDYGELL
ncbi:MAG: hypothetical protein KZQ85_14735 [Candidatus Thiodiazotropha sp. (ex Myrtea sp. 'scaly one' KF741663)]|nr:hypothetical protein [Candidatus Thiodiazotropha sp. (ex Myrtea sp. 'scaly one' KF741663)]